MTIVPDISRADYLTGPDPADTAPGPDTDRSLGQTIGDTAIDVGRGFTGAGRTITTLGRDIAGEGGFWEEADKATRAANDWLGQQKSDVGRAIDTGEAGWSDRPVGHVLHEAAQFAPWALIGTLAAAAAPEVAVGGVALGPVAAEAGVWGALSDTQYRQSVRDIADNTPLERLNQLPQFQQLMKDNNGDEKAARNELYQRMKSSRDELINAGIGAGMGLMGPAGKLAGGRVGAAALDAGLMGTSLGAQGGFGEYSRQAGEQRVGLRDRIDAAPIIDETLKSGLTGSILGGVTGALRGGHGAIDTRTPPLASPIHPDLRQALASYDEPATPAGQFGHPDVMMPAGPPDPNEPRGPVTPTPPPPREGIVNPPSAPPPPAPYGQMDLFRPPYGPREAAEAPSVPPPSVPPSGGAAPTAPPAPTGEPGAAPVAAPQVTPAGNSPAARAAARIVTQLGKLGGTREEKLAGLEKAVQAAEKAGITIDEHPELQAAVRKQLADIQSIDNEGARVTAEAAPPAPAGGGTPPVEPAPARGGQKGKETVAQVRRRKQEQENAQAREEANQLRQQEQEAEAERQAAQPTAIERQPERPSLIDPTATFVGHNEAGRPIWQLPNGRRQYVEPRTGEAEGVLREAGRMSKNPAFIATQRPRVFDTPATEEVRAQSVAAHQTLQRNIERLRSQTEKAAKKVHWENIKENVEDLLEGRSQLDTNDRAKLSESGQRAFDRVADRIERNRAARATIEEHVASTRDNMDDLAEDVNNDREMSFEHRVSKLREMVDRLRQLQGNGRMLYNYLADSIRKEQGREPYFETEFGRPRAGQGLWHNFLARAATVQGNTERLLREIGADPDKPASEHQISPSTSTSALMKLRANEIMSLDKQARRGEKGMSERAEEASSVNTGITEQRRTSTGEVEKLAAEQAAEDTSDVVKRELGERGLEEAGHVPAEEYEHEEGEAPPAEHLFEEASEPGAFTWEPERQPRVPKEPEPAPPPVRQLEGKELAKRKRELERRWKKERYTKPVRRRLDPELSDDHLDALRKKDPEAAGAIDRAQKNPFDYTANREALEGLIRAGDKLEDPEDLKLADGIRDYLKQVVSNQERGRLNGRDSIAGVDDRLARLWDEDPEQFHMVTTAGKVTDMILSRSGRTPNEMLRQLVLGKFRNLIKDVPVTVLEEPAFRKYLGPLQFHLPDGIFNPETGHIVINRAGLERGPASEILGHEFVHAASEAAFQRDPQFRQSMRDLLGILRRDAIDRGHASMEDGKFNVPDEVLSRRYYGLTDEHELLAEAWNNPDFQDHLANVNLSSEQWRSLGLDPWAPPARRNVWRAMVDTIARALGYGRVSRTALQAAMELTNRIPTEPGEYTPTQAMRFIRRGRDGVPEDPSPTNRTLLNKVQDLVPSSASRGWLKTHFFTQLTERGEEALRQVTRPVYDTVAKIGEYRDKVMQDYKVDKLMRRLYDYIEQQDKDGDFKRFMIQTTMHGAHPDVELSDPKNAHISPTSMNDEQTRLQHPQMMADYDRLVRSDPRAEALYHDLLDAGRKMNVHDANVDALNYYFQGNGHSPELSAALTKSMLKDRMTDAERALVDQAQQRYGAAFDEMMDRAKSTPDFRRIAGPYVPLMRHGSHVVRGDYDLTRHAADHGGTLLANKRTAEFSNEAAARRYIKDVSDDLGIAQGNTRRVVYDKTSGEPVEMDADALDDLKTTDPAAAANLELRHQVDFNPEHFETFDRKGDARRRLDQLAQFAKDNNLPLTMRGGVERLRDLDRRDKASPIFMSEELARIRRDFERSPTFLNLPEQRQRSMLAAFEEASTRSKMRSAAAARFLPRQLTKGASDNLLRNYAEFFTSTANYTARARYQTELENRVGEMERYVKDNQTSKGHELRRSIADEITHRVNSKPQVWSASGYTPEIQRLLGLSYLDKLGSPGFLGVNMTEPMMLGIPMIGQRHGGIRTALALMKAYNEIGGLRMLARGGADFGRALIGKDIKTDWMKFIKDNLGDEHEQALMDHIAERGWMNKNAEQQLDQEFAPEAMQPTPFGKAFIWADRSFRQLNTAVENLNRSVTAVAAYRLELKKNGGDRAAATRYAEQKLAETAGNYSAYNAPPMLNTPLGKIAGQFKKYPIRVAGNYIRLMATAMDKELSGEQRLEALRGLMLATVAQSAVAGALGLPTEPLKYAFTAGNIAGLTPSWDTAEHDFRSFLAKHFGPEWGEILSRGLPRYAGVDLGRLGHDSLFTFGTPPSNKPADLAAGAFHLVAGAPGALIADWIGATQNIVKGGQHWAAGAHDQADQAWLSAARDLLPIKTGADIIDAYLRATKSSFTTMPSGAERQPRYGLGDQIIRGLGFTPGWEAEAGEARRYAQAQKQVQQQNRQAVVKEWVNATPAERNALWAHVQQWNASQPPEQRLTRWDLIKAQRTQEKASRQPAADLGVKFGKRDTSVRREYDTYNVH